jgi:hypothetical protein
LWRIRLFFSALAFFVAERGRAFASGSFRHAPPVKADGPARCGLARPGA